MVYIKNYDAPPFNYGEILRYASTKEPSSEVDELIKSCICEVKNLLTYKVCYSVFDINNDIDKDNLLYNDELNIDNEDIYICDCSFSKISSKDLYSNLNGCKKVIVFAATIGLEIDRLIKKYSHIEPSRAVILQAIGAERIESLCTVFVDNLKNDDKFCCNKLHPRFSPGYGDLPLDVQRDIFLVLNCNKHIGLSLNHNLLMTPSKSVTAFIGIE